MHRGRLEVHHLYSLWECARAKRYELFLCMLKSPSRAWTNPCGLTSSTLNAATYQIVLVGDDDESWPCFQITCSRMRLHKMILFKFRNRLCSPKVHPRLLFVVYLINLPKLSRIFKKPSTGLSTLHLINYTALIQAERTGYHIFLSLWPYVLHWYEIRIQKLS